MVIRELYKRNISYIYIYIYIRLPIGWYAKLRIFVCKSKKQIHAETGHADKVWLVATVHFHLKKRTGNSMKNKWKRKKKPKFQLPCMDCFGCCSLRICFLVIFIREKMTFACTLTRHKNVFNLCSGIFTRLYSASKLQANSVRKNSSWHHFYDSKHDWILIDDAEKSRMCDLLV